MNNEYNNQSGSQYGSLSSILHTSQAHTLEGEDNKNGVVAANGAFFEAYGYSKAGHSKNTNTDNFYCGSTYMKGFRYVDFKRTSLIPESSAVFAVCSGKGKAEEADDACKKAFEILQQREKDLTAEQKPSDVEKALNRFMTFLDNTLYSMGRNEGRNYSVDILVTVFVPGFVIYASLGNVMLIRKKGKSCGLLGGNQQYTVGYSPLQGFAPAKIAACSQNDVYLLCSNGITNALTVESIADEIEDKKTMKEIAVSIIGKVVKCGGIESSTCVSVKTNGREIISKLAYIISAVCGVITLADLFFIIKSFFV